jgi:phosphoadenosine phosphosulfate reductase
MKCKIDLTDEHKAQLPGRLPGVAAAPRCGAGMAIPVTTNRIQQYIPLPQFDLQAMADRACALLREHQPPDQPYYGCFSGGKDSIVIKRLAELAGVNVEWHYNVTTIDPPELVRFIKREHPDVIWDKSRYGNFFRRMESKADFPTRVTRWCCREYKEGKAPRGSTLIMGIRAEESARRAQAWQSVTDVKGRTVVNPMIDWASDELWEFIHRQQIPYCSLYDEGFHRLGCVGCPMAGLYRIKEFRRWPGFERRWELAFKRIWQQRAGTLQRNGKEWFGSAFFRDWKELWDWWLSSNPLPALRLDGTRRDDQPALSDANDDWGWFE